MICIAKRASVKTINVVRRSEQKDELLRLGCGAPASCPAAQATLVMVCYTLHGSQASCTR